MGKQTDISWSDHTFNPWQGCQRVSSGCKNCYAETRSHRFGGGLWGPNSARRLHSDSYWKEPLAWDRAARRERVRRRVFTASLGDAFEDRADLVEPRLRLWNLIARTPNLDWLILTKRPQNIAGMLPDDWGEGWPNVWLGTSIESANYVHRAEILRSIPAVVRFISYEPALGPIHDELDLTGIDWLIYGGEAGPVFRQDDIAWAEGIQKACAAAGVAFFYKQMAARWMGTCPSKYWESCRAFPAPRVAQSTLSGGQLLLGI